MKKPKRITKWMVLNKTFNTFKEFKNFAWYNMIPNEVTIGVELFEDTIYKEYKITKKERRLIIEKTYDMWEEHIQQLKMEHYENQRDAMDRNYPSYFDRNNCNHYYTLCAKLYNEFKRQQKQSKLNAKTEQNNIER